MTNEERTRAFLDALAELTRKHRIGIWSCSCCNKINGDDIDTAEKVFFGASYDDEDNDYFAKIEGMGHWDTIRSVKVAPAP